MDATNSQSEARERAGGSTALNIVRTLTIFLMLAALSFVMGFFVLARLIPGAPRPASSGSALAPNGQDTLADRTIPPASTHDTATPPSPKPGLNGSSLPAQPDSLPTTRLTATPGPSLDPANDVPGSRSKPAVQKPHGLETVAVKSSAPQTDDGSATTVGARKPAPVKAVPPDDAPPVARPKRHKTTARIKQADSSDTSDSGDNDSEATTRRVKTAHTVKSRSAAESGDSGDTTDFLPAKPKFKVHATEKTGAELFHVHLGAFHSRDAAISEIERARAKGFTPQIVPVTRNGRTLYRVQVGAFRDRERAESVQQSLQDANLDARITDVQR